MQGICKAVLDLENVQGQHYTFRCQRKGRHYQHKHNIIKGKNTVEAIWYEEGTGLSEESHHWIDEADRCLKSDCGHLGMDHYGGGEYYQAGCKSCDEEKRIGGANRE